MNKFRKTECLNCLQLADACNVAFHMSNTFDWYKLRFVKFVMIKPFI